MAPRLGLALSGGGFRAAAFHLGVLRGLRGAGRLDEVEVVSAVSGGALLAAAWVASDGGFEAFEARLRRFLAGDLKRRVLVAALRPDRLVRMLLDPHWSLTEVLAGVLDRELFEGRTLGSLRGAHPRLVVNATCVNHGTGWRFAPERLGDWILKTTDRDTLARFPLARAVAASAAFPGGLAPLVLDVPALFPGSPHAPREVLLTDGGVDDNLGVQALLGEGLDEIVVSDGSFPFAPDARPLDRFGLPLPRRLLLGALLLALALWGAARLDLPAGLLGALGLLACLALLRLRFALWLFGDVMLRGQRRGQLRRLFASGAPRATYLGLATRLSAAAERELVRRGFEPAALRRVTTDLALSRRELEGLIALGETLALERLTPRSPGDAVL